MPSKEHIDKLIAEHKALLESREPETICHINPITKEIKYILKGHEGPKEIVDDSETGHRKMVRYIPYSEYLDNIAKKT